MDWERDKARSQVKRYRSDKDDAVVVIMEVWKEEAIEQEHVGSFDLDCVQNQ